MSVQAVEYAAAASAEGYPELGNVLDGGKKLAILGLPWETS